jgi:hypothetical protein
MLVVQIHYAGHILDKVMLSRGKWEQANLERRTATALRMPLLPEIDCGLD